MDKYVQIESMEDNLAKAGYTADQITQIVEEYNKITDMDRLPEVVCTPKGELVIVSKSLANIVNRIMEGL